MRIIITGTALWAIASIASGAFWVYRTVQKVFGRD